MKSLSKMSKKDKGYVCECYAKILAIRYGYEPHASDREGGKIDIMWAHMETKEVIKIDVKMASYRKTGKIGTLIHRTPTTIQRQLGVIILYIDLDDNCNIRNHWFGNEN
tara:strand:- start:1582 stop:1908 length:327 start_codon:yes stop_codon:yes gene_type:complete